MSHCTVLTEVSFPKSLPYKVDSDRYLNFLEKACEGDFKQIIFTFPIACKDPLQWLSNRSTKHVFQYYWENPSGGDAVAALGSILEISADGPGRFNSVHHSINDIEHNTLHFNATSKRGSNGIHFVGGFSFFDEIKPSLWDGFQPASFTLPEYTVIKEDGQSVVSIAIAIDEDYTPKILHRTISKKIVRVLSTDKSNKSYSFQQNGTLSSPPYSLQNDEYQEWIHLIEGAKQRIKAQKFEKIVLGRLLELDVPDGFNTFNILKHLRSGYPKCCSYLIRKKNAGTFIGSSPELLLSVRNNQMETEALAGSMARGSDTPQDKLLETELLTSVKNRDEHSYVLKDIKKLLAPSLKSLKTTDQPIVKKLANVQHLYTPVEGTLRENTHPISLLEALHPTPAVGGTPRKHALPYIRESEPFERGWFAAPIGWINTNGRAEFSVAIRSGLIHQKTISLFAGCGILADSNPEAEWQETNLKFTPMLSALHYD